MIFIIYMFKFILIIFRGEEIDKRYRWMNNAKYCLFSRETLTV